MDSRVLRGLSGPLVGLARILPLAVRTSGHEHGDAVSHHTIWICHDDRNFLHACRRVLAALENPVVEVGRSERAARTLERARTGDAVVVDLDQPGVVGTGFLDHLRERTGDLRVLLLASSRLSEDLMAPGWRQLTRPFDADDLVAALVSLLDPEAA